MEITGKALLQSAEGILRERRQEWKPQVRDAQAHKSETPPGIPKGRFLESRLLQIQDKLTVLQGQYSREQARDAYLNNESGGENLAGLLYENTPLFPELATTEKADLADLQTGVAGNLAQLLRGIKGLQIEMENLLALNFRTHPADKYPDPAQLSFPMQTRNLDPARVARLTG